MIPEQYYIPGRSSSLASQHTEDAHTVITVTMEEDIGPASSPPSSSPVAITPPDCLEECQMKNDSSASPFLCKLDALLLAAQGQQGAADCSSEPVPPDNSIDWTLKTKLLIIAGLGATSTPGSPTCWGSKRAASGGTGSPHVEDILGSAHKKRKLSKAQSRISATRHDQRASSSSVAGLSGAFGYKYAKGPGSLRRAESLRSGSSTAEQEEVLNEVVPKSSQDTPRPQKSPILGALVPQALPIVVGNVASPFGGYAPTVPTTPTANDVEGRTTSAQEQEPLVEDVPVIPVPPFESLPKPPRSKEEAAERRLLALLARERDERDADGLQCAFTTKTPTRQCEDEEERFWMDDSDNNPSPCDDDDADSWATILALSSPTPENASAQSSKRAQICPNPIQLDIDDNLMEQVFEWILEVMPADDHKTSYSPGDLYDLLSSSPETRFHAGYLFVRYLLHVRSASTLASLPQTGGKSPEDQEALEAVTWDVAVACLALSIKFHRDVLFPLDVIYVHEFLDLAPHEMEFEDLENAQRDVLEAVAFRVGSATPGAFIEELWDALTPLRRLVSFDGRWEAVQEEAWEILNDALQQPELLQYPPSLITGAAVIEAVVEVLQRSYKTAGVDGRGKPVGKRDARSLRKVALKCSRGVRLDIQDILQISNEDLRACQKWLGLTTG